MPILNTTEGYIDAGGTVSSTALTMLTVGFTAEQLAEAETAWITCNSNALRYRYTGSAPTISSGHKLVEGASVQLQGNYKIQNFRLIRDGGSDATYHITLEK